MRLLAKVPRSAVLFNFFFMAVAVLGSSQSSLAQVREIPAQPPGSRGVGSQTKWAPVDSWGPAGRLQHAMAYDSARDRVVLFGGRGTPDGGLTDSGMWEFDGATWVELTPATVPTWREGHAMAYDSARGRVVLFGGAPTADTWEWDGNDWIERTPTTSPAPRVEHAMAYDSARGCVVLFGGAGSSDYLDDTWEWDGSNWVDRTPATSPSPRAGHAMAYDSLRGRVVLFGGWEPMTLWDGRVVDDTWEWDGSTWVEVEIESNPRPAARSDHSMVFDSARGRVVLFGGGYGQYYLPDTWELIDGTRWAHVSSTGPERRSSHAMVYDSLRGRVVLYGGYEYDPHGENRHFWRGGGIWYPDTWEYGRKPWARRGSQLLGRTEGR